MHLKLKAFFLICLLSIFKLSAQNYTVQRIPSFTFLSTAGIPIAGMMDDQVYGPFPIGFNFCFYGNTYNQFWIGSNGWVSFSPGQPGSYSINATIPSAGASYCKNCIMGPFEDWLPFGSNTNVFYQTRGTPPCRQLVVTFLDISLFGGACNQLLGTFQIVLNETTNIVENHLFSKPSCPTWQNGNAIHGIHNLTGTVAAVVLNRNAVPFTANQESWRFTPQNFCIGSLDTIRVVSIDTSRSDFPVVEGICYDTTFSITLNTPVFCSTVDSFGTDFRLYDEFSQLIPIKKVSYTCANNYTDSLTFTINNPPIYESEYFLVQRIGYDGNTIGNCLSFRNPFDTVVVQVRECYAYDDPLIMTNVSVLNNEEIQTSWKFPDTLDLSFYEAYHVAVNDTFGGSNWFTLAEIFNAYDTTVTVKNYDPSYERRDWRVRLKIKYYPLGVPSDSIAHMYLRNGDNQLYNGMRGSAKIEWSPYLVWGNPVYNIYEARAIDTNWVLVASVTDTFFVYEKQRVPETFLIKVETVAANGRVSVSNFLRYTQEQRDVEIVNVSTPNGDGVNDELFIRGIDFYPNSKVMLFNRWGQLVYESSDYRNDWSPSALEGGTYFCIVEVFEKGVIKGAVEIVK